MDRKPDARDTRQDQPDQMQNRGQSDLQKAIDSGVARFGRLDSLPVTGGGRDSDSVTAKTDPKQPTTD